MKGRVIALSFAVFLLACSVSAKSQFKVVVVANSLDWEAGKEFYGFLGNKGMDVVRVNASDFADYSAEKFVVILGGQNAPEGVGDIVKGVLTEAEQSSLLASESSAKMFVKTNVWATDQVVRVFAGYGREETAGAWKAHKEDVAEELIVDSESSSGKVSCESFCMDIGYASGECRINPGECRNKGDREVYKKRGDVYCRYRTGHRDTCCCVVGNELG
ncbi:MAG: hypothetical protein ABH834_02005 [Candidatus Altiarchaeota archaeon]